MPNRRWSRNAGLALLALCSFPLPERADAQTQPSADALKSELYFGLRTTDGQSIGEQAWEDFISEVVMPRFPAGLTVLEARGRSGGNASLDRVRVLVLVHPIGQDAQTRLGEIKAEYRRRFASARIFHIDQPIRVHAAD